MVPPDPQPQVDEENSYSNAPGVQRYRSGEQATSLGEREVTDNDVTMREVS